MWLRQSTASQEIELGRFLDPADGDTEMTALTIANTDIKLWKEGATSLANKNSGGATHMANGLYYAVLDATDTGTLGKLVVHVHVAGALAVKREFMVLPAMIYDALVLGTDRFDVNITHALDVAWGSGAITRAALAADTGLQAIRSNTAQAGAAGTITLDASASAVDDFYNDRLILITGGTGAGQTRLITDYNGTTKVATIGPNWATNPDNTSTFAILGAASGGSVWHKYFEGTLSILKALRRMYAGIAGLLSGGGTPTEVMRDSTDAVDRITATVDSDGNRTAITFNDTDT